MNSTRTALIFFFIILSLIAVALCFRKAKDPCKKSEVYFNGKCYVPGVEYVSS